MEVLQNQYEIESLTSKRFSVGEVLAAMHPEDDNGVTMIGPPVDFSFKEIRKMPDVSRLKPREGAHSYVTIPVCLPDEVTAPSATPSSEKKETFNAQDEIVHPVKYCSKAIRLSNNSISSLEGFTRAVQSVIELSEAMEWIDLSFNELQKISEVLLEFKNLKVLYLHANYVDDITQIDKLASLPQLKTLTLHGNVIDEVKGYRQYVISMIPQLQYLDFSRVTRADRDKASTWTKLKLIDCQYKKKKKKKSE